MRLITCAGFTCQWRFVAGYSSSQLVVKSAVVSGQRLEVRLADWQDPWLHIVGFTLNHGNAIQLHSSAHNQPAIITPSFVRSAIEYGLSSGWQPERSGSNFWLIYSQGAFSLPAES